MMPGLTSDVWLSILGGAAAIGASATLASADPPRYEVVRLETFGFISSDARSINNSGQVVATYYGPGVPGSFIWHDGVASVLQPPPGGFEMAVQSITDAGDIAGQIWFESSPGVTIGRASLQRSSSFQFFDPLPGFQLAQVVRANSSGVLAGDSYRPVVDPPGHRPLTRATLWSNGAVIDPVAGSPDAETYSFDLSSTGRVLGSAINRDDTWYQWLWSDGQTATLTTPPGWSQTYGCRFTPSGQIMGLGTSPDGGRSVILWDGDNVLRLGAFDGPPAAAITGVNASLQVVGVYEDASWTEHLFFWQDGHFYELNDLIPPDSGWRLLRVAGINNDGWIIGNGWVDGPNGTTESQAFLLRPVPSPSAAGALSLAAALAGIRRRRP